MFVAQPTPALTSCKLTHFLIAPELLNGQRLERQQLPECVAFVVFASDTQHGHLNFPRGRLVFKQAPR